MMESVREPSVKAQANERLEIQISDPDRQYVDTFSIKHGYVRAETEIIKALSAKAKIAIESTGEAEVVLAPERVTNSYTAQTAGAEQSQLDLFFETARPTNNQKIADSPDSLYFQDRSWAKVRGAGKDYERMLGDCRNKLCE